MPDPPDPQTTTRGITRITAGGAERIDDTLVVEKALEIRIDGRPLAVTLRTPGHDRELALGFLASEAVIAGAADVQALELSEAACADEPDRADVRLAQGVRVDWSRLERAFVSTSACGLCGRAHLDSLRARLTAVAAGPPVSATALMAWAQTLDQGQAAFKLTGGLHAAALADDRLELQALREDVGRHNAVDKIAGWLVEREEHPLGGRHPLGGGVLWVSGRAGAEIVLKAARAGIGVVAAVGAPSSLAVELAQAARLCLVGFLRSERLNVYAGEERLVSS